MNRRSFIRNLAGIGVFSILPGAGRIWKAQRPVIGIYEQMILVNECVLCPWNSDELLAITYRMMRHRQALDRLELFADFAKKTRANSWFVSNSTV